MLIDFKCADNSTISFIEAASQPSEPPVSEITAIKRAGRIATLKPDAMIARWDFMPRSARPGWNGLNCPPQTIVFNSVPKVGKGPRIPYTSAMDSYLSAVNSASAVNAIEKPAAGWINKVTTPPTIERLSWSLNSVVVQEVRGLFSRIYAPATTATRTGTFFDRDNRLVLHKFTAICKAGNFIKLAAGLDCYTPLARDGELWILSEELEMWPELPFALSDGRNIFEYNLFGHNIYGVFADGASILLRDKTGFKTNWDIECPEVPL